MKKFFVFFLASAFFINGAAFADTLDAVKKRDLLKCGVNTGLAGFGQQDKNGKWNGFDVDYCRAVAAAILGDPNKVSYMPLSAKDRFVALQSGEIDLLARNSTWTLSRDVSLGLDFPAINYFDGQGFMVRRELKVNSALELSGASVCAQQGTTTELNLADYFRANNMKFEAVVFATLAETIQAYEKGRCDVYTTDVSGIYADRSHLPKPDDHLVLPEVISKEPLALTVRQDDSKWSDIVRWVHFAMVSAEEYGVTTKNVDEMRKSSLPDIRRLLGIEGSLGKMLGLDNDWAFRVIKMVGNYGEVFSRNIGEESLMKISRGQNALWNKGGLIYAPPVR